MNTNGVQTNINITATDTGLNKELANLLLYQQRMERILLIQAKSFSQTAQGLLIEQKQRTELEKTIQAQIKNQQQLEKDAIAKEQGALKTQKMRLEVEKLNRQLEKTPKANSGLYSFSLFKLTSNLKNIGDLVSRVTNKMWEFAEKSSDYIETLNLFGVSFGEITDEGDKFVKQMSNAFNIDDKPLRDYMGTFQLMGKQMGLTNENALIFSKTLTQLAVDTSSLRNTTVEEALVKLKSGIVGETEAVRQWGIDITEATLRQTAMAHGISKQFSDMSYAEKSLLRYASLLEQTTADQGDFARTLESPAQLLKQIANQIMLLGRAIGNVLLPFLYKVLQPLLAIIMVLKEITNWLAMLLGFGDFMAQFDSDASGFGTGFAKNLNEGLDGAISKAKKLKDWLGSYDELNNVTASTSSSGTSGSGVSIGIDPEFLKLLGTYDNGMGKVLSKAREIRDTIMKWLGFIYDVNTETWKLRSGWSNFKTILVVIGTLLGALTIAKLISSASAIMGLFTDIWGIIKAIGNFTGFSMLFSSLSTSLSLAKGGVMTFGSAFTKFVIPSIVNVITRIGGIIAIIGSIVSLIQGISDLINGDVLTGIFKLVEAVGLLGVAIGLLTQNYGLVIGAGIITGIGAVGSAFTKQKDNILELIDAQNKLKDAQMELTNANLTYAEAIDRLEDANKNLIDVQDKNKLSGEELAKQVEDGTLKYEDMNFAQKETYKAYLEVEQATQRVQKASEDLQVAQDNEQSANWELQLSNAKTSKSYDELKDNIINAWQKGELSTDEARDYLSRVMGEMDTNTRTAFEQNIPNAIKDGLDPSQYESNATKLKNWWQTLMDKMEEATKKLKNWVSNALGTGGSFTVTAKTYGGGGSGGGAFADGGIPNIGSLFLAGEGNSTEFVGNIGGRTNVVNEAQLENAMYNAMVRANKLDTRQDVTVVENYIGGNKTDSILTKRSKRYQNITGKASA